MASIKLGLRISSILWATSLAVPIVSAEEGDLKSLASLSLDRLLEIQVTTPGKVPEPIRDASTTIYLFSRRDIERQGHQTLTDIFENVPGFYNIDNDNGVSGNFGVRGYWNGRSQNSSIAILVNGIPQMRVDTRSHPMEALNLPVEAIDRIEFTRGPSSVIYGNGASFGAINIITNESYFNDQINVSYGSRDTQRTSLRWTRQNENAHIILNAGYYSTDGADYRLSDLMGPENLAALPFYGIDNPDASVDKQLEHISRFLQLSGSWKEWYFDYSLNDTDIEHFPGAPALDEGSIRFTESSRITLGWKNRYSNDWTFDIRASHNDYNLDQAFDAFYPGFPGINWLTFDNWDFEALFTYTPHERWSWTIGYNWQRMQDLYEFTYVPDLGLNNEVVQVPKRDAQSIFSQSNYTLNDQWKIGGGFRFEERRPHLRNGYTDITQDTEPTFGGIQPSTNYFTPQFSLIYQPDDQHVLKLLGGEARSMSSNIAEVLPTEKTRTLEINYIYSKENLLFSASVFKNSLSNQRIEEARILPNGNLEQDSIGSGKVSTLGLEMLITNTFADFWRSEVGITTQDSEDRTHPERLVTYSPRNIAHLKLIFDNERFSAALTGRWIDGMEPYFDVIRPDGMGGFGAPIGQSIGSYTSFDMNFRWDHPKDLFHISLHIANLLDEEIRYPNNPINSTQLDRGIIGQERSLFISTGFRF